MAATSNDVANLALSAMGYDGNPITGQNPTFDSSTGGKAAARFYQPVVSAVMRQFAWDFALMSATLSTSGNTAPFPWSYEYIYPSNCIQALQISPGSLSDANNPLPIEMKVGNAQIGGAASRVIWSNQASAKLFYTGYAAESTWDALFREAVVRLMSSVFALAVAGKPEAAETLLESYAPFERVAEGKVG